MIETAYGLNFAFTAPHRVATKVGTEVLAQGGSAVEAMIAAAATIAVVYPHMNGIGGDGFWIIHRKNQPPIGISACGQSAALAEVQFYRDRGFDTDLPTRGGGAAITVAGTVGGWQQALDLVDAKFSLPELLAPAIDLAKNGTAVTRNQSLTTRDKLAGLVNVPGFADVYLVDGAVPIAGTMIQQTALGQTLQQISDCGTRDFYHGEIASQNAKYLEQHDSPLRMQDFQNYQPQTVTPLSVHTSQGTLYNMIPPTQGMSSLAILGIFDRLGITQGEGFDHIHGLVEATKQAFVTRNAELGDPAAMRAPAQSFLTDEILDEMAGAIDRSRAMRWPHIPKQGDTIWMGAADANGMVVSFIQSVYWEFGSGLTCPQTGVVFQNRGAGFSMAPGPNQIAPNKRPFHTLNPALAHLTDGRVLSYGTMGGEGQPQTQAAIFTRFAQFGMDLQPAITAPRWLLGKTWGDTTSTLKIEGDFDPAVIAQLRQAGHDVELVDPLHSMMGHAGAVLRHADGRVSAANDPRCDGAAFAI